ncbi:uncharacterized protein LOC134654772 [Cydia amplana]|uniref:uncharacterized protein LOC134654772 n=1 Tax=Cydia amplana TaxID=1869771 RepID=UPI002FE58F4D
MALPIFPGGSLKRHAGMPLRRDKTGLINQSILRVVRKHPRVHKLKPVARRECDTTRMNMSENLSSRDSYLETAVGYVQICREGGECKVKARVVPEHNVNKKPYTVVCIINENDDVIIDSTCEDPTCAAAAGGCKHSLLLLFWLVKKSLEPASTSTECYWNKPPLSPVRVEHVSSKDIFPRAKKLKLDPKDPSILAEFYEECDKRQIKNSLIVKHNPERRELNMNIFDLTLTLVEKNLTYDYSSFKDFLDEVVDSHVIKTINEKTEGQIANIGITYGRGGLLHPSFMKLLIVKLMVH